MDDAPIRLLVIDDDPDVPLLVRRLLERSPHVYQVESTTDPGVLRWSGGASPHDAWLLDHHLGRTDGVAVLRSLPQREDAPPVIVLSASADPVLTDTYLSLGAADFLSKEDLKPGLLDRAIRFAIAQSRSRREIRQGQQALLRSERLATIGRMAAGVAHEYNNLHAVILAGFERLRPALPEDERTRALLLRITDALARSHRISSSLLMLGAVNDHAHSTIDLRARIVDVLTLMELKTAGAGIALEQRLAEGAFPVRMEANDLHMVVSNLVANAIHAVHRNPDPRVSVRLERRQGRALITVADNGVGIPPDELRMVFQPFFTRKGAFDRNGRFPAQAEGAGLGLAVVQALVDHAGGSITVSSQEGRGTEFIVDLPLFCEASLTPGPLPVPRRSESRRVAVLDDNHELLQLISESLAEEGWDVRPFQDPERFLIEFPALAVDHLVLDWRLPGMSGGEVLTRLVPAGARPPLRLVVISGEHPEMHPDLGTQIPPGVVMAGMLTKPFPMSDLIRLLTGA